MELYVPSDIKCYYKKIPCDLDKVQIIIKHYLRILQKFKEILRSNIYIYFTQLPFIELNQYRDYIEFNDDNNDYGAINITNKLLDWFNVSYYKANITSDDEKKLDELLINIRPTFIDSNYKTRSIQSKELLGTLYYPCTNSYFYPCTNI